MAKAFVGGLGWVEKQTKTVDITENGSIEIIPDRGKVFDSVTINTNTVGDSKAIEAALDEIISIQTELLGIITFTIDGTEYTADKDMTWSGWCDSEYDTAGFWYDSMLKAVLGTKNGLTNYVKFDNKNVRPDDTIVAGRAYVYG
jgi:hypothetical protein